MNDAKDAAQILKDFDQIGFVQIALIVIGAWVLVRLVEKVFPWLGSKVPGRMRLFVLSLVPVLRLVVMIAGIALVVPQVINPTVQNLVAILGAAGLALGFAFKDYASSLVAGVVAIYEKPYRPGDWVRIDGAYGEVQSLGLRALRMVTPDDTVVVIPHMKIWDTNVYNDNDGQRDLLCVADFYLHPAHDAAVVRRRLYDVALTSPYLQPERPVNVIAAEKPWGTHYRLKAYPVDGRDQFLFTTDLTVRGKAVLARLGAAPAVPPAVEAS